MFCIRAVAEMRQLLFLAHPPNPPLILRGGREKKTNLLWISSPSRDERGGGRERKTNLLWISSPSQDERGGERSERGEPWKCGAASATSGVSHVYEEGGEREKLIFYGYRAPLGMRGAGGES